jgi:hypothetical protein
MGAATALLQVSGAGGAQASLTGSGAGPATLRFDVTSASFDTQKIRPPSAPMMFTLTNVGGTTAVALSAAVFGTNAGSFLMTIDNCTNVNLAPGASCTVTAVFAPTSGGDKRGEIYVSAANGAEARVALGGTCDGTWLLTASTAGAGTGTVYLSGTGLQCPANCTKAIDDGSAVFLDAEPGPESVFVGWSGCNSIIQGRCYLSMSSDRAVTASFAPKNYNVTVAKVGEGTVTSTPSGVDCGNTCAGSFASGTNVELVATPIAGGSFERWGGACSGTEPICTVSVTEARGVTAYFTTPNRVFVTSTKHVAGNIGGQSGGDAICQARATAAGLGGTYRAWLSSSTTSALAHVAGGDAPRGFSRTDGKPFADTLADIVAGRVLYPITRDEFGQAVPTSAVATGTTPDGNAIATWTCNDWTTTTGDFLNGVTTGGTASWTSSRHVSVNDPHRPACSDETRLYCFGTDFHGALAGPVVSGRRAFVTEGFFEPGTGLGPADALCASEATAAGLSGTFKALLATESASAISRFSTTGTPWSRVDGVQIVQAASDLTSETLTAALDVTASGKHRGQPGTGTLAYTIAWSGALNPGAIEVGVSCSGWSVSATSDPDTVGRVGAPNTADESFFGITPFYLSACGGLPIYCLEQ